MSRFLLACACALMAVACGSGSPSAPTATVIAVVPTASPSPSPVPVTDNNLTPPVKTKDVRPAYPEAARLRGISGTVVLEAIINQSGRVVEVLVIKSVDPLLDDAAVEAVQQWEYTPALLNGRPVPVIMTVTVNFILTSPAATAQVQVGPMRYVD